MKRTLDVNSKEKYDYYLSNAPADTPLEELARFIKAEHLIEDSLKRTKSEAGFWLQINGEPCKNRASTKFKAESE